MTGNDPLIGKQLGDYEIQSVLGQGGMARVYKGYDDRLDRYAAVKVIEPNLTSAEEDEEYRERFQREARAIARLNHPRVVGVYQFNNTDNLYYMAMVFVEGQDLRHVLKQYIKKGERLSHKQILQIVRDTAEALDYSHKQGVIHRDVKPSNIMIQSDGHAVLTDFGLALNAQEGTIGNTFGSVHYIAPEQAMSSAQAVAQSDLYSLGVVLYEMLVGRVPFEDVSAMTVALQHISDPPPPPRTINPDISQAVEDVVIKVLDKDPLKRYHTGQAFVYALEAAFATSDDEETHDVDHQTKPVTAVTDGSEAQATTHQKDEQSPDTAPIITSPLSDNVIVPPEDHVDTISDSSQVSPGSLPFSPVEEKSNSRNGLIMGVVAIVIVLAVIAGVVLLAGGGDGDDTDATSTAQAVAILAETSTADAEIATGLTETVDTMTNTPVSTDTPQATATEEMTSTPTTTATSEATETDTVTRTPSTTPTTEVTPTTTTMPTNTTTVTPSLVGTPTYSVALNTQSDDDPAEILLRYTGQTIVLYNRSSRRININGLSFTRLSDNTTFRASEWNTSSNNLNAMRAEMCYQGLTTMFLDWNSSDPPADMCLFRQGIRQTVRSFWASRTLEDGEMFAVRLSGETLAECPVTEWNSEDEVYCLVDIDPPQADDDE